MFTSKGARKIITRSYQRWYHAQIQRTETKQIYYSRRHFRTASEAVAYANRWSSRLNRHAN